MRRFCSYAKKHIIRSILGGIHVVHKALISTNKHSLYCYEILNLQFHNIFGRNELDGQSGFFGG